MKTKTLLLIGLIICGKLISAQNSENVNLFDYAKGVRVVDFSSNYGGGWDAQCILQNNDIESSDVLAAWCTEENAPFPHFITVEFVKTEWLNIIDFNNKIPDETGGWEGISAKDIEVYVSTTSKNMGFTKVVNFRLENNKNHQIVKINPIQAKWVKIVITENYGHAAYTEMGQIGVFDDKTRNTDIQNELQQKGFINLYGLYFDFASDKLRSESSLSIDQIVDYLKANPSIKIQIEGHTDNIGSETANQMLSENRAKSVKSELISKGIPADRLSTKGFGSTMPVSNNNTDIGRAQNRRVTIRKI